MLQNCSNCSLFLMYFSPGVNSHVATDVHLPAAAMIPKISAPISNPIGRVTNVKPICSAVSNPSTKGETTIEKLICQAR